MSEAVDVKDGAQGRLGGIRLAVGLAQGLALYALNHAHETKAWPATDGPVFAAFALGLFFAPLVVIGGIGHLRRTTLIVWVAAAAVVAAGLSAYAVSNAVSPSDIAPTSPLPDFTVFAAMAAFVFIAHHLIVPADAARRWLAPYPAYFDVGWLDAAQLGLALAFTGAFWLLLQLGASLFQLIGISGFRTTIQKDWFAFPVTAGAFAIGVHLADVRVGLTRGLRTIGLFLLSWLLPLMTLIAVGFLVSLLSTGLAPLWKSRVATGVMLSSVATLIVLINAVYRDGAGERAPLVLRWATRITAVALVPLAGLAGFGLWLRIAQHGLTPERIVAGACLLVSFVYALGYAFAALSPGTWMRRLEGANVAAAFLILALILALFSPIADPGPISVRDQVARLERGAVAPGDFDFSFLRFRAGKAGLAALNALARRSTGPNAAVIAQDADRALKRQGYWTQDAHGAEETLVVYPKGTVPPPGLATAIGVGTWQCRVGPCEAFPVTLASDGSTQYVVAASTPGYGNMTVFGRDAKGDWSQVGAITMPACPAVMDDLRAGKASFAPPVFAWKDIIAGGIRLTVTPSFTMPVCPSPAGAAKTSGAQLPSRPPAPRR